MISYNKIFKQAYALMRAHKFLWALGLFFVLSAAANFVSYSNSDEFNFSFHNNFYKAIAIILGVAATLLFLRAKAAVIFATDVLLNKQMVDFPKSFGQGLKYYGELFKFELQLLLYLFAAAIVLALPIFYLISQDFLSRARILGALAILILIPLMILVVFLSNLGPIFIVLHKLTIKKVFEVSFDLIKQAWPNLLGLAFFLGLLNIVPFYLLHLVWLHRVAFTGNLSYNLLGIVIFSALLFVAAMVSCFQEIAWVIFFREIVKPQKNEEEEILPIPEII